MWPLWLQVTIGILNFALISAAWLWWPKKQSRTWLLLAVVVYLVLFIALAKT